MRSRRIAGLAGALFTVQICVILGVRRPDPPVSEIVPPGWLDAQDLPVRRTDPLYPCGVTCLSTAARLLDVDLSLEEARQTLRPGVDGAVSLESLAAAFRKLGLCSVTARVDPTSVPERSVIVAFVQGGHFVVLRKAASSDWYVSDLPYPTFQVSDARLREVWDGTAAFISQRPDELAFLHSDRPS